MRLFLATYENYLLKLRFRVFFSLILELPCCFSFIYFDTKINSTSRKKVNKVNIELSMLVLWLDVKLLFFPDYRMRFECNVISTGWSWKWRCSSRYVWANAVKKMPGISSSYLTTATCEYFIPIWVILMTFSIERND